MNVSAASSIRAVILLLLSFTGVLYSHGQVTPEMDVDLWAVDIECIELYTSDEVHDIYQILKASLEEQTKLKIEPRNTDGDYYLGWGCLDSDPRAVLQILFGMEGRTVFYRVEHYGIAIDTLKAISAIGFSFPTRAVRKLSGNVAEKLDQYKHDIARIDLKTIQRQGYPRKEKDDRSLSLELTNGYVYQAFSTLNPDAKKYYYRQASVMDANPRHLENYLMLPHGSGFDCDEARINLLYDYFSYDSSRLTLGVGPILVYRLNNCEVFSGSWKAVLESNPDPCVRSEYYLTSISTTVQEGKLSEIASLAEQAFESCERLNADVPFLVMISSLGHHLLSFAVSSSTEIDFERSESLIKKYYDLVEGHRLLTEMETYQGYYLAEEERDLLVLYLKSLLFTVPAVNHLFVSSEEYREVLREVEMGVGENEFSDWLRSLDIAASDLARVIFDGTRCQEILDPETMEICHAKKVLEVDREKYTAKEIGESLRYLNEVAFDSLHKYSDRFAAAASVIGEYSYKNDFYNLRAFFLDFERQIDALRLNTTSLQTRLALAEEVTSYYEATLMAGFGTSGEDFVVVPEISKRRWHNIVYEKGYEVSYYNVKRDLEKLITTSTPLLYVGSLYGGNERSGDDYYLFISRSTEHGDVIYGQATKLSVNYDGIQESLRVMGQRSGATARSAFIIDDIEPPTYTSDIAKAPIAIQTDQYVFDGTSQASALLISGSGPVDRYPLALIELNGRKLYEYGIPLIKKALLMSTIDRGLNGYGCSESSCRTALVAPNMPSVKTRSGKLRKLPNLPGAEAEGDLLKRDYEFELVTDSAFNEASFFRALETSNIVHFATHALSYAGRREVGESFVAMSPMTDYTSTESDTYNGDGLLTVSEILKSDRPFRSSLVVISACESGSGYVSYSSGQLSVADALVASGVEQVVATLWSIDDEATRLFMDNFYDQLQETSVANALVAAQKRFRDSEKYSDPAFWAPFYLIQ